MKVDGDLHVLAITVTIGVFFLQSGLSNSALNGGIGDAMFRKGQHALQVGLDHASNRGDRLEAGSNGPTIPISEVSARVPVRNLLGPAEGKGFAQMMKQLPFERLCVAVNAVAIMESAVAITTKYVKERSAFGKPLIDFQNTRFKLAECKTEAHIGRVFLDNCIQRFIAGELDAITAAMAKYWLTDCQCRIVDECVQLHGGYGYLTDNLIAQMWTDSRVERIYAGTNEIMKEVIGWSL